MDNLTHSLFGLTLGRTSMGRAGRGTGAALLVASNAPDIDIVAVAGGGLSYLQWHRGPTHGPIGVIGLGLVTAAIVWVGRRWWDARSTANRSADRSASFLQLWSVAIAGVICHILMDLPTSYGVRPLSPFDWHWFAQDWMPIVDIYLLMALGAGLLVGRSSPAARRRNAAIALGFMMVNYGVRAIAHQQAIAQAPRLFGAALPRRCSDAPAGSWIEWWPRPGASRETTAAGGGTTLTAGRCLIEIAAMPEFVSPLHWRVIARLSNAYETRSVTLLALPGRTEPEWRTSVRHPNQWTPAVATAARTRVATVFLGFSRFPTARSVVDRNGEAIVRLSDMRFVPDSTTAAPPRSNLFTAVVRLDRDDRVIEQRLGP